MSLNFELLIVNIRFADFTFRQSRGPLFEFIKCTKGIKLFREKIKSMICSFRFLNKFIVSNKNKLPLFSSKSVPSMFYQLIFPSNNFERKNITIGWHLTKNDNKKIGKKEIVKWYCCVMKYLFIIGLWLSKHNGIICSGINRKTFCVSSLLLLKNIAATLLLLQKVKHSDISIFFLTHIE